MFRFNSNTKATSLEHGKKQQTIRKKVKHSRKQKDKHDSKKKQRRQRKIQTKREEINLFINYANRQYFFLFFFYFPIFCSSLTQSQACALLFSYLLFVPLYLVIFIFYLFIYFYFLTYMVNCIF